MEFKIPCEVFARMANASIIGPKETRMQLNTVRIEHYKGNCFVVATNAKILAIQNMGPTDEKDGAVNVIRLPELIEQCLKEAAYDSMLTITDIPELKFTTAKTSYGYTHPGNVAYTRSDNEDYKPWYGETSWRSVVPTEQPKKSNGCMFLNSVEIANLGNAAPSKQLVFPKFIDFTIPVVVQDQIDKDWCGMFLPQNENVNKDVEPAIIPDWMQL